MKQKWTVILSGFLLLLLSTQVSNISQSNQRLPRVAHPDEVQGYFVDTYSEPESMYFNGNNLKPEYFARYIYRPMMPNENATKLDLISAATEARNLCYGLNLPEPTLIGDTICPLLYAREIVALSDRELAQIFQEADFNVCISSLEKNGLHARAICLYFEVPKGITPELLNSVCFTFLQCWNDKNVWVQPVAERSRTCIKSCALLEHDEVFYLILEGVAQETRPSLTYMGFVFRFEDNLWKPCPIASAPDIDFICDRYRNVTMMQEGFIAESRRDDW